MAGGYSVAQTGEWGWLRGVLEKVTERLDELERPSGTQTAEALKTIRALVDDLAAEVAALAASGVTWAGPVSTAGSLSAGGSITAAGPVSLVDTYNFDVTSLPGQRRTMSVHVSGRVGQTVSTKTKKTNEVPFPVPAAAFLELGRYLFQMKAQIDIRDNPDNPYYDPNYEVPWEPGYFAEELQAAGLGMFVYTNEDGTAAGINYDLFAAVGFGVVGADHETRISFLEALAGS